MYGYSLRSTSDVENVEKETIRIPRKTWIVHDVSQEPLEGCTGCIECQAWLANRWHVSFRAKAWRGAVSFPNSGEEDLIIGSARGVHCTQMG